MNQLTLRTLALVAATCLVTPTLATPPGQGSQKLDSQVSLVRPLGGSDANAKGTLRTRSDEKKPRERFDVKVQNIDASGSYELWIEDAVGSDVYTLVSALEGNGEKKYSVDTKKGDALPLDAADNEALIGLGIEIRLADAVILEGTVPPFGLSKKPTKESFDLRPPEDAAPAPTMTARVKMRSKPNKGQERIDIKAKNVPFDSQPELVVFVESAPESGEFVAVGPLDQIGSKAKGLYRRDTKKGQALPLDVAQVTLLAGRRIEIRDGSNVVYLEGLVPSLLD